MGTHVGAASRSDTVAGFFFTFKKYLIAGWVPRMNHHMTTKKNPVEAAHLPYELIVEKIKSVLIQEKWIDAAYLLGSIVRGAMHPHSDIDLAILIDPVESVSTFDRLLLTAQLQNELSFNVDIGIMGSHDVVYAAQAILHGDCIFFRDQFKKDMFAATCLSLYTDLKRQRIEVEHAYRT